MIEIPNHSTREYSGIVLERIKHLKPGGKMGDLPKHLQHESFERKGEKNTGGPNMRLLRLEKDKPSLTVTAFVFNKFVHPIQNRYITAREAACLQDFPNDWVFKGTMGEIQMQIGNAVPVKLATAIAESVAKYFARRNSGGLKSIASYFSGAGGLDLGFENVQNSSVSFQTKFCTDIEVCTQATINANRPDWNFRLADIRNLSTADVISAIGTNPDVIIGGPPCQPFSVAGKQRAITDPLGKLYSDFIGHVASLLPSIVVMENVYGMAQVKSVDMIGLIYKSFSDIGYKVTHRELLAADYGTPQRRRRLIFIASKDLHNYQFPEPTHCESLNLLGLPVYNGAGDAILKLPNPRCIK
ncbi:MAG: DNA (cytosine-5-)-methyltransferase [Chitinophagaceae bacterium]